MSDLTGLKARTRSDYGFFLDYRTRWWVLIASDEGRSAAGTYTGPRPAMTAQELTL